MAKRKHKRRRMSKGAKIALGFVLVFSIAVAVMAHVSVRRVQRVYDEAEARRQALLDYSWIDSDFSLSWTLGQSISEKDEEGYWVSRDYSCLLRTQNFADGTITDIPLDSLNGYGVEMVPSDDPRGFVLADWDDGDVWSLYRLDDAGGIVPMFYEANGDVERILGWYGGKLYCEVDEGEAGFFADSQSYLTSWDRGTQMKPRYRGNALCLESDGRAVIMEPRATGIMELTGGHTDENGEWIEDYSEMKGWTLGIEDAQGGWTAIAPVGNDSEFAFVPYAAWLDDGRLLLGACTDAERRDNCSLYLYTLSTGEITPWPGQDGAPMRMGITDYFLKGAMSVSPDGRYIAYRAGETGFKVDSIALMVQSLETGRYCKLSPQDAVEADGQRIYGDPIGDEAVPIWR